MWNILAAGRPQQSMVVWECFFWICTVWCKKIFFFAVVVFSFLSHPSFSIDCESNWCIKWLQSNSCKVNVNLNKMFQSSDHQVKSVWGPLIKAIPWSSNYKFIFFPPVVFFMLVCYLFCTCVFDQNFLLLYKRLIQSYFSLIWSHCAAQKTFEGHPTQREVWSSDTMEIEALSHATRQ